MRSRMAAVTRKFIGDIRSGKDDSFMEKVKGVQDSHLTHQDIIEGSDIGQLSLPEYSEASSRKHNSSVMYEIQQTHQETHVMPFTHDIHSITQTQMAQIYNCVEQSICDENSATQICHNCTDDSTQKISSSVSHPGKCTIDSPVDIRKDFPVCKLIGTEIQQCLKGKEQWKKTIRKKMKNLGKGYTTQNGKEIYAKVFTPVTQCCCQKCFQNLSMETQKTVFTSFWEMGDWNKQTKYIWEHIEIKTKARKTSDASSRRVHTRHFFLPDNLGNRIKVCKKAFLSLLQVSNGRLSYSLTKKIIAGGDEVPQDKRGLQSPSNKTPTEAVRLAEQYIQSSSYYSVRSPGNAKMFVVPQGVTIRKLYGQYHKAFLESGRLVVSLKVFRRLLPPIMKKDALNMPFTSSFKVGKPSEIDSKICVVQQTGQSSGTTSNKNVHSGKKIIESRLETDLSINGTEEIPMHVQSTGNFMQGESSHSEMSNEPDLLMSTSAEGNGQKLWKRQVNKMLRDKGKSYLSSSGKMISGKVFLPQYSCCVSKCYKDFSVDQQEILFKMYWDLGSWNLQTAFLWNHIEVVSKKNHTTRKKESRRVHTRIFFLPNEKGEKVKVCKFIFCAILQVSNGRVSRAVCPKAITCISPHQDKRGKNSPQNKASEDDALFLLNHASRILQHNNCQISMKKCSLLHSITKKKAHTMYVNSCHEHGRKPLSYTVYCQVLRDIHCPLGNTDTRNAEHCDIGANLTDEMYQGMYHGSKKHEPDLDLVLKRAWEGGLSKMIITGTSLSDSKAAIDLAKTNDKLFCTVGCHPTRCGEFEKDGMNPETYLENLLQLALDNRDNVIAIGECGLDYDRTQFCAPEIQRKYFEEQISLAEVTGLPMFLHCRNSAADLVKILSGHREKIKGGVVHSFDGTKEEAQQIMELDLYIGLNGCSLKTEENLAVAASIPAERLMIETDCPWCEIRPTHAGHKHIKTTFPSKKKEKWEKGVMVKSRNEPNCIVYVL